jgi:integrase
VLADFKAYLTAKGKTAKHVNQTHTHCRAVLDGCRFGTFPELDSVRLAGWLAEQRETERIGPKTSNYYLRDFKAFVRWLGKLGRMPKGHPCLDVEPIDAGQDVRRARRELAPAELLAVLAAAKASGRRFKGLDGSRRYYLYLTACGTGFRVQELASLTPEAFSLDGQIPTATVSAKRSENRRVSMQPLPAGVVAELRPWLAEQRSGKPLWPGSWKNKAAEMIQVDLSAAGVPYSLRAADGTDRYADFHALRHTYITYLSDAGLSPKHQQELARHSDFRLTGKYTHAQAVALSESVNRLALPDPGAEADPFAAMTRPKLESLCGMLLATLGAVLGAACQVSGKPAARSVA